MIWVRGVCQYLGQQRLVVFILLLLALGTWVGEWGCRAWMWAAARRSRRAKGRTCASGESERDLGQRPLDASFLACMDTRAARRGRGCWCAWM